MARPNIVRADTIDLQDPDNPTASEHSKPATENGIGVHQRAEVDHVIRERHSEEEALAEAWNIAGSLTDEPDAINQAQQEHEGTQQNGEDSGNSETDGDDDMMDRISSSPSIDDGVYTTPSSRPSIRTPESAQQQRNRWPKRTSSLSPSPRDIPTPTREIFNQSPPTSLSSSSPFLQTPQHLPLHVRRTGKKASPLQRERFQDCLSSSPFDDSPEQLPMIQVESPQEKLSLQSKCHHGMGRYTLDRVPEEDEEHEGHEQDEGFFDEERYGRPASRSDAFATATGEASNLKAENESDRSVIIHKVRRPRLSTDTLSRQHDAIRNLNAFASRQVEQSPSFSSIQSVDISDIILPTDDPLLDKPLPPSPPSSSGSWETESEHELDDGHDNDDDTDALFLDLDERFIDSGWGGECLRDTEDIDFEFVYALHTFVATVEGQANATKGDTMVLLDDSNSYWWLVRVVKDSSIGYLPAEHIETPTERLARLNKHRNIDLSATMLSDNAEKSRNPLKKAMKRRNAKTVQFAAPTYVEASDNDYSSDEEESGMAEPYASIVDSEKAQQDGQDPDGEARASSEARTSAEDSHRLSTSSRDSFDREQAATLLSGAAEEPQLSPKLLDKTEAAPLKSRKGTARNADSFLKDDTIETRKITLTPGILREDGSTKSASSESARNTSMESLVKTTSPPEQVAKKDGKKEKEKKEKKQGMLSGLFKSKKKDKDKKSKEEVVESEADKPSNEYSRESPRASPAPSGRSSPSQQLAGPTQVTPGLTVDTRKQEVQTRQPSQRSKLSKVPPSSASPSRSPAREEKAVQQQPPVQEEARPQPLQALQQSQDPKAEFVAELAGSEAAYEMAAADDMTTQTAQAPAPAPAAQKEGPLSPLTNMLKSSGDKPAKAKRSKQRMELDDFDAPADEETSPNPFKEQEERARQLSGVDENVRGGELEDSPVEVSHNAFMHGTDSIHIPMPGQYEQMGEDSDDEKEEEKDRTKESSRTSSPSLVEAPPSSNEAETETEAEVEEPPALSKSVTSASGSADDDATPTGPRSPSQPTQLPSTNNTNTNIPPQHVRAFSTSSSNTNTNIKPQPEQEETEPEPEQEPPWSDAALRAWLEDGSEVRDMMTIIYHDKSGVVPVGDDHPAMKGLWVEERRGVGRMMGELDALLEGFLRGRGIQLT